MPSTTLNWLSATSRPRIAAGAISAMYIGATTEEPPMARPPMNRNASSDAHPCAKPQPRVGAYIVHGATGTTVGAAAGQASDEPNRKQRRPPLRDAAAEGRHEVDHSQGAQHGQAAPALGGLAGGDGAHDRAEQRAGH